MPSAGSPRAGRPPKSRARPEDLRAGVPSPEGRPSARRILDTELTYVAHPSFDDPTAHDAILAPAPAPAVEAPGRTEPRRYRVSYTGRLSRRPAPVSRAGGPPVPQDELPQVPRRAGSATASIRHRPRAADLDEVERLQAEALELKNQIVEANLRLVVSVAKKPLRPGYDLSERVSDGNFALLLAVDRFDFARGNRFSTYATWAILNEFTRHDRKERRRRNRSRRHVPDSLASPDSEGERYEQDEAQAERRTAVERFLGRLDGRERRILANRHGIGGVPEQTLSRSAWTWGSARNASARSSNAPMPSSGNSPASRRSSRRRCDAGRESDRTWDSRLAVGVKHFLEVRRPP